MILRHFDRPGSITSPAIENCAQSVWRWNDETSCLQKYNIMHQRETLILCLYLVSNLGCLSLEVLPRRPAQSMLCYPERDSGSSGHDIQKFRHALLGALRYRCCLFFSSLRMSRWRLADLLCHLVRTAWSDGLSVTLNGSGSMVLIAWAQTRNVVMTTMAKETTP